MKLIPNSLNYFVTEKGEIYKNNKSLRGSRVKYVAVKVQFEDGSYLDRYVHRLVAQAFIPNPENKPEVNHKDGNKQNNSVGNLEWVTRSENAQHAVNTGLNRRGAGSCHAAFSEDQVHQICKYLQEGYRVKDLVEMYEISQPVISSIKNKTRYKNISSLYTFPEKSRTISNATVMWICEMIEEGKTDKQITDMYYGDNLYEGAIQMIRTGRSYKDISKDYKFK